MNKIHVNLFNPLKLITLISLLGLGAAGCSWVKVDPEAESVRTVYAEETANCQRLGVTTAKSMHKVGFISRNEEKVKVELNTLARNDAAKMGGNTIVVDSGVKEGSQRFVVYRCP